jgi:DNA polymerase-4
MQSRKIIHVDMDAFYAAIEQRDNPQLKGLPIVVGMPPKFRGVVSTASYEARKFGIHSAMSTYKALKLCPEVIIVEPNFRKYQEASKHIFKIIHRYTDIIESLSLDEGFLDISKTAKDFNEAVKIAQQIKQEIKKELNLTASAGVSINKLLAKIASDYQKPDGLFVIAEEDINDFMQNLDIKKIFGVGKVAYKQMLRYNIKTCGDLQKLSLIEAIKRFGSFGEQLYYYARGIDTRAVSEEGVLKSIGSERTLPVDSANLKIIQNILFDELKIVVSRLNKNNFLTKTISIKIKYDNFKQITRSKSFSDAVEEFPIIYQVCLDLLTKSDVLNRPIRLIGVSLSNFVKKGEQLELDFS